MLLFAAKYLSIISTCLAIPLFSLLMPAMETWNQVLVFTLKAINSRASIKRDGELIAADTEGRDMLSRWAYVKSSDPDKMSTRDIIVHLSTNVFAGSDTTAIALRAIVYFLCQHPEVAKKMIAEIDEADIAGNLSTPVSYKEASTVLPYMSAVVREAHASASVGGIAYGATCAGRWVANSWTPPACGYDRGN